MTDRPLPVARRRSTVRRRLLDWVQGIGFHSSSNKTRATTSDGCHVPYRDIVSNCFWPPAECSGPPPNLAAARRVGAKRFHSSQLCLSQRQTQEAVSTPFVSWPTPNAFFLFFSDFFADGACRFAPHTKDGVAVPGLSIKLEAPFDSPTWPLLAVSSVFHLA